jgi:hypothetical protein
MNTAVLQTQLELPYRRETWQALLPQIFPGVEMFSQPTDYPLTTEAQRNIATGLRQLGRSLLADAQGNERIVAIFEVDAAPNVQLSRNRVALRQLVARCIDEVSAHAVLAFFVQPGTHTYRMTYAARESVLGDDLKVTTLETAPKRYTYELGPHTPCRTAAQRLSGLASDRDKVTLKDVTDAFSVEKLNTEFFTTYKQHYQAFCDHLLASNTPTKVFGLKLKGLKGKDLDKELKPVRDFAKKLLGRLVFLHFLQKKGWLGCPERGKDWTGGDPQFLKSLYAAAKDKDRFHSRCLGPLFFDTLNNPGRPGHVFKLPDGDSTLPPCRIPYLNGGLFERDFSAVDKIDFPAALFDAVLEFFGQYNFTIDENDPDDHEIGIDPEMLGHIFENLLEDNKDKGAYYTPKAIVQYMCQQSLIHYLQGHFPDDPAAKPEIEQLIRQKNPIDAKDAKNWLTTHAHDLEKLLNEVKICDPAIGSGAFPIGLLQEIYWTKLTLHPGLDRAKAKRDIIQNAIHGVDIDLGAVEIARLRFWLSLIVDEDEPRPLPNLDFKIMQGDSLLESFEGIPLDKLHEPDVRKLTVVGEQHEFYMGDVPTKTIMATVDDRREITDLIKRYFDESDPVRKAEIHKQVDRFILDHIDYNIQLTKEQLEIQLQQHQTEISSKRKVAPKWNPPAKLEKRLVKLRADIKACDARAAKLRELESKPERPYFLWHLFFQDVFQRGGFDIVIANPPYVRHEVISEYRKKLTPHYTTGASRADLYVFFYERAYGLLRDCGVLTFISSDTYYRSKYGKELRQFLQSNVTIEEMIDFVDSPVFEAIAYASIFVGTKEPPESTHRLTGYTWERTEPVDQVLEIFDAKGKTIPQADLRATGWLLEGQKALALMAKLRANGTALNTYVDDHFYYGIKTGLNEAFVIDQTTRDQLVAADARSAELIKPFLRGRDVKRWHTAWADLYVLAIPFGFHAQLGQYPAVLKHLSRFETKLKARGQCTSSRGGGDVGQHHWLELDNNPKPAYLAAFEAPKVVIPAIERQCAFAFDDEGYYSNDKTTICVSDEARFLCAVLNSSVTWWLIQRTAARRQNGYYEFKPMYVSQLPVPVATQEEKDTLDSLARRAAKAAGSELAAIEAEIDQIVFRLFKLDRDEISLIEESSAPSKQPLDNKTALLNRVLPELTSVDRYVSTDTVKERLSNLDIALDDAAFRQYMSEAMAKGVVHDAGRGWYSSIAEPFVPDPKPVHETIQRIKKAFPLLDFSCWSTQQINPYMHHLLAKFVTFVHVDEAALRSVGEWLKDEGFDVFVNPGKAEVNKSFTVSERTVVLRPGNVDETETGSHIAPAEMVLVDLLHETQKLPLMGRGEAKEVVQNVVKTARISMGSLLMIAKRRRIELPDGIPAN